jgi:hypothetical protein
VSSRGAAASGAPSFGAVRRRLTPELGCWEASMVDSESMNQPRSMFVTVVAWIFIVLSGFCTVISILQNIMVAVMFQPSEMSKGFEQAKEFDKMPFFLKFFATHTQLIFLAGFVLFVVVLIVSIALLKRRDWARWAFIAIMAFGIAWNIFAIIMQQSMVSSFPTPPDDKFATGFRTMMIVMRVFSIILALLISALFAWIIRRLLSANIKNEFLTARR